MVTRINICGGKAEVRCQGERVWGLGLRVQPEVGLEQKIQCVFGYKISRCEKMSKNKAFNFK